MKSSLKKKQSLYFWIFSLIFIIILPFIFYLLFLNDFQIKNFESKKIWNIETPFKEDQIKVCYGNIFFCKEVSVKLLNESVNTNELGIVTLHYKLNYKQKEKDIFQQLYISDLTPPQLKVPEEPIKICPNKTFSKLDISAIDNIDGDISENIKTTLLEDKIIFEISDASGNYQKKEIKTIKEDNIPPEITLKGEEIIYLKKGTIFKEPGFIATDNCIKNIEEKVIIQNDVNNNQVGEYDITYQVTDDGGNKTIKKRKVYVYDFNNSNVPNSSKIIYLTFDDGPSKYTENLLNILKKYNVKATFFITNQNLSAYSNIIERAHKEGHTIGLHTDTHQYKTIYQSEEAYLNDLYSIQNKVEKITGMKSNIIRFPGGSSNTISKFNPGIMSRLTKIVCAKGFYYFDWNIDSDDAGKANTTDKVVDNVKKALGKNKSYIVLQHDIKKYSVDAVESIIQYGLSNGYTFQALTENSPAIHHHVNN